MSWTAGSLAPIGKTSHSPRGLDPDARRGAWAWGPSLVLEQSFSPDGQTFGGP